MAECDRCGCKLTKKNNKKGFTICDTCSVILDFEVRAETAEKELQKFKWVMIKDELPEDGTWNLFTDGKQISVERYKCDAIDHFYPSGRFFELEDAVAWMSLPDWRNL